MAQQSESRALDKVIIRLPDGMRDRIKSVADANNRSMNAEIVATLEEAYPAPTPTRPLLPFSDQEMFVLQWSADRWHPVDWDLWIGFRAGMRPKVIEDRLSDGKNFFVVVVFDDESKLANVIVHSYIATGRDYKSAGSELLNEEERAEYNRLMMAVTATDDDETRLRQLRKKMEPAFTLPPTSISMLIEGLSYFAPRETVEHVLRRTGIIKH